MKALRKASALRQAAVNKSHVRPNAPVVATEVVPVICSWRDSAAVLNNILSFFNVHYRHNPGDVVVQAKGYLTATNELVLEISSFSSLIVNVLALQTLLNKAKELRYTHIIIGAAAWEDLEMFGRQREGMAYSPKANQWLKYDLDAARAHVAACLQRLR